jgi:uncharacterized protein
VKYLPDGNVLVAWGWLDHVDHERTVRWLAQVKRLPASALATSPIPELGFVRVSVQRTAGRVTVQDACETLQGMLRSWGDRHTFLPDDQPATDFPAWCRSATRTTDAHLYQLARAHEAELVTLDAGIPGAFVIPELTRTR